MNIKYNRRVISVYCFFVFLFIILALKIFYLQVFKSSFFQSLADNQHYRLLRLEGKRGSIFDCQGRILARGLNYYSIFADPKLIENPLETAKILALNLGLSEESLVDKFNKKKRFAWIKRKVGLEDKEKIKSFKLKGIGFIREQKRFYPQDELSSSFVGFVDIDNKGVEGLELFYNSYLSGKDGWVRVMQDSMSREVALSSQIITPHRGADIALTVDAQIQYWAQYYLKEAINKFKAKSGSVVIMDALSGGIIALVDYPSFNPNELNEESLKNIRNRAVCDMFEPGSVFKAVTLAAAVSGDKFLNEDKIFCENGKLKIPGTTLHDWKSYGELSFEEVFMKSSNIGVGKIVQAIGPACLYDYIKRLGFGRLTGIDLPGETKGSLKPLSSWSKTSEYIIPIGQEIGVNLIQLVGAFAAIVNGGYSVKPHLVENICSQGFCKSIAVEKKRVISSSAAQRAKNILIKVVEEGTGKRAGIKERKIGGKTGTAQKYDPKTKRYSLNGYRANFIGFLADSNPPLVIGITVDEPKVSRFGGVVAAPIFKEITQKIIQSMN
ncbi:MAG: penicillin-binding protein 2 [Candidatus Omnitrophota bacterium]